MTPIPKMPSMYDSSVEVQGFETLTILIGILIVIQLAYFGFRIYSYYRR